MITLVKSGSYRGLSRLPIFGAEYGRGIQISDWGLGPLKLGKVLTF